MILGLFTPELKTYSGCGCKEFALNTCEISSRCTTSEYSTGQVRIVGSACPNRFSNQKNEMS